MQEKFKIYDLLVKEFTTYPPCNITPEGLTIIAERLDKKYTYEQVERAMGRLAYKARFFPSLAEIAEEIDGKNKTLNEPNPWWTPRKRTPEEIEFERKLGEKYKAMEIKL